jgi:acyl-CoA dehydrogenase
MELFLLRHPARNRRAVRGLCARFPTNTGALRCAKAYPDEFVAAMTEAGWLAALIPEQYGGSGLGLLDACVILQEINAQGGNARRLPRADVHHGQRAAARQRAQKKAILPRIAAASCACRPSA